MDIISGIGLLDNILGFNERIKAARDQNDKIMARREIGRTASFYGSNNISTNQEVWDHNFHKNSELSKRFDNAATPSDYLQVFREFGFIVGTPTAEQAYIIKTLVQSHVEEASSAERILIEKIQDLDTAIPKLPTQDELRDEIKLASKRCFYNFAELTIPWQERREVAGSIEFLGKQEGKRVLLLTGSAGRGKSAITAKVVQFLESHDWLVLAFRLDYLSPTDSALQLGKNLGLTYSPVKTLAQAAGGRLCLLLIDQLDAVSKTSGRQPAFFGVVRELLDEASLEPNMRVLLACREFDLANDDRFQQLVRGQNAIAQPLAVSLLTAEQVKNALTGAGFDPSRLSQRQIEILQTPLHLSLFFESWTQQTDPQAPTFQTVIDLYDVYWHRKQQAIQQQHPDLTLADALSPLVNGMNRGMTLSLPDTVLDRIPGAEKLLSEGIIRKQGGRVSFFHEGFFDFAYARQFVADRGNLLETLLADEQHLFRRAQVRQILTLQRQKDVKHYLQTVDDLLKSPKIRYHVKELVLSLLLNWPDPTEEEWKIVQECMHSGDHDVVKFSRLFSGAPAWTNFFYDSGLITTWFDSGLESDRELADQGLRTLLHYDLPTFLSFAASRIETDSPSNDRFASIINWRLDVESREFFDFVVALHHLDAFDDHRFWAFLENLSKTQPQWAIEGAAIYLRKLIANPLSSDEFEEFGSADERIIKEEWHATELLERCATADPQKFVTELLPEMLTLAATYSYTLSDDERFQKDRLWHHFFDFGHVRTSDVLLRRMVEALGKIQPESFSEVLPFLKASRLEVAQYLLLKGYTAHAQNFADEAIETLCAETERLHIAEHGSLTRLCTQLLKAVTPHASAQAIKKLEDLLLFYEPEWRNPEKSLRSLRYMGWTEYRLLVGIEPTRRSERVKQRIAELGRKFPNDNPEELERTFWGGMVGSPIPDKAFKHMTDKQWIAAMRKHNSDHMDTRKHHEDGSITGGSVQLARMLGAEAKKDPERFARLALNLPDDIVGEYFEHLVLDLRDTDLDPALTLELARRCHALPGRPCGRWLPDLFSHRPEVDWPQEALQIVVDYALNDPSPSKDDWLTGMWGGEVDMAGINSVRGRAAEAIGSLLGAKPERFSFFRPVIEKMLHDPIVAARVCTAYPVGITLNIEPDLAVDWFLQLADTHEAFLVSRHALQFMNYACGKYFDRIRPLIDRMLISEDENVVKHGAILACLAAFNNEDAHSLAEKVVTGSKSMRLGAVEVYSSNIAHSEVGHLCLSHLPRFFNDEDAEIRKKAASFLRHLNPEDFEVRKSLINEFIASKSFRDEPMFLLHALQESAMQLPATLLDSAEAYMLGAEQPTFGEGTRDAFYVREFGQLLFSLYTQHLNRPRPDAEIMTRCLNLFDQMARWRSHEYYEGMQSLERS